MTTNFILECFNRYLQVCDAFGFYIWKYCLITKQLKIIVWKLIIYVWTKLNGKEISFLSWTFEIMGNLKNIWKKIIIVITVNVWWLINFPIIKYLLSAFHRMKDNINLIVTDKTFRSISSFELCHNIRIRPDKVT